MKVIELFKNMGFLAIGGVSTKIINFLLIPLYTAMISVEEYGSIDLLVTISTLLTAIVSFQMYEAIFKFVTVERENFHKVKRTLSNIFFFSMVICVVFGVVCVGTFQFFNFLGKWYVFLAVISNIFFHTTTRASRSFGNNKLYSFAGFISAVISIFISILFLVILKFPAISIVYAYVLGPVVGGMICVFRDRLWQYCDLSLVNITDIKIYFRYSLPLVPNEIAWWCIHAADRLIITAFLGVYYTGLLAVAAKFSLAYSTIFGFFYASWAEQCFLNYKKSAERDHMEKLIPKIFMAFCYVTIIFMIIVSNIYPIVISYSYNEAYSLVPWYLIAVLLNVVVGLVSPIYLIHNETKIVMYSTMVAGVINVVINIITIEFLGVFSAPVAAIIGYGVVAVWRWFDVKKRYMEVSFSYKGLLEVIVLGGASIYLYYCNSIEYRIIFSLTIAIVGLLINHKKIYFYCSKIR